VVSGHSDALDVVSASAAALGACRVEPSADNALTECCCCCCWPCFRAVWSRAILMLWTSSAHLQQRWAPSRWRALPTTHQHNAAAAAVASILFQGRVVSGHSDALDVVSASAAALGALKVARLAVSGAFHTRLMAPARAALMEVGVP
jgi:hypothetical protein